jgi:hypothetical protein
LPNRNPAYSFVFVLISLPYRLRKIFPVFFRLPGVTVKTALNVLFPFLAVRPSLFVKLLFVKKDTVSAGSSLRNVFGGSRTVVIRQVSYVIGPNELSVILSTNRNVFVNRRRNHLVDSALLSGVTAD